MNRNDFPILNETVYGKPLVYLDNAATSQKPRQVLDAVTYAYEHFNANIHRGVHHLSQVATEEHEAARAKVASFIGAGSPNEIVFTKGTTDSINTLAFSFGEYCVHEGDNIIVSAMEHHSNIVPWQMLCQRKGAHLRVIPLQEDLSLNIEAFKLLLDERTKLVSVAHVSNVLGVINPVREIIEIAHSQGVPVCIDGAQSVPHMRVNVRELDCDFMAFSAHKMYGPTGIGVLYGKEGWLEKLPPAEGGGEMIEHVRWENTTYNTLPYKFEAGTPDFNGSFATGKAIDYMLETGLDAIEEHERNLVAAAQQAMRGINLSGCSLRIYAEQLPKAGVISFNVFTKDGNLIHPYDVGVLLDRQGVAIRTGHHCAEPLIDFLEVPGTIRVSFGLYNDEDDVQAFAAALEKAIAMLG